MGIKQEIILPMTMPLSTADGLGFLLFRP